MRGALAILAGALALSACGPSEPAADQDPAALLLAHGKRVYAAQCLECHQSDGLGVPKFQPALVGSDILAADPDIIASYVLMGSDPDAITQWAGVMPAYAEEGLSDRDIAAAITYARSAFTDAGPVSIEQVAAARADLAPFE